MSSARMTAASILLLGFSIAHAGPRFDHRARNAEPEPETATATVVSESKAPAYLANHEPGLKAGWAAEAAGQRTILAQLKSVLAAQNPAGPTGPAVENVQVATTNLDPQAPIPDGNGSEGCRFMEIPGSRIREWRCYYPNDGEKELNQYQFAEEIRFMTYQQEQMELIRQQQEAMQDTMSRMGR